MIVRLLQWNILRKEDPDKVIRLIKKINPDIITAQELIQNTQLKIDTAEYIASKLNLNYFYHAADTWSPAKNGKTSQGNAIFSKFPFLTTGFQYVNQPHHNPPDANFEGRIYIEVSCNINSKKIFFGTTHLSFSPKFIINDKRRKQVDNLISLVKNKKNYCFTGDLNSAPDTYTITQLKKYLVNAGPDFDQSTWTTKPFDYHGQFKEDKLRWRLDYVFCTPNMKVKSSKIISTAVSDHLPILVEFVI